MPARRWPRPPATSGSRALPARIPPACLAATVELRGYCDVSDELAGGDARALFHSLQHLGYLAGDPGPAPAPLCDATALEATEFLRADAAGILAYQAALGDRVKKGDIVAWLVDPAAEDLEQARRPQHAGTDGLILSRQAMKYVAPGRPIAKIVGTEPLPRRQPQRSSHCRRGSAAAGWRTRPRNSWNWATHFQL